MTGNYRTKIVQRSGPWGLIFLFCYIGAAIYFVSNSNGSFWAVILGLLQAIVWPVYVIYHVLLALHA